MPAEACLPALRPGDDCDDAGLRLPRAPLPRMEVEPQIALRRDFAERARLISHRRSGRRGGGSLRRRRMKAHR